MYIDINPSHIPSLPAFLSRWFSDLFPNNGPVRTISAYHDFHTNNSRSPSEIVPVLRPSLRGKGLHFGRWRLIRSDAKHNPGIDPEWVPSKSGEKRPARIIISDLLEPGVEEPKYEFEMELALRQTSRGR